VSCSTGAMAMVIPRSRSSGALSIVSNARYSEAPFRARYFVMAAVRDVLPWSIWPIVPMLTCGLVRSNFFFAIVASPWLLSRPAGRSYLELRLLDELGGDRGGHLRVVNEFHRRAGSALGP